jgi:sulfide dehydrogenase cytochrome subunit
MITHKLTKFSSLAAAALLSLTLAGETWAADAAKLAESCADCHEKDGVSHDMDVPTIGGMSAPYLVDTLTAYKNKERPCPEAKYKAGAKKGTKTDMCQTTKDLAEGDIKKLADYYAGKKFVHAVQNADPVLAKKGKAIHEQSCEKCHTEGGTVASDDGGILAGQWMPYLREQFKDYSAGKRPMAKKMKPKFEKLQQADLDALINYYGSFK